MWHSDLWLWHIKQLRKDKSKSGQEYERRFLIIVQQVRHGILPRTAWICDISWVSLRGTGVTALLMTSILWPRREDAFNGDTWRCEYRWRAALQGWSQAGLMCIYLSEKIRQVLEEQFILKKYSRVRRKYKKIKQKVKSKWSECKSRINAIICLEQSK